MYEGSFNNNSISGNGTRVYSDGTIYEGELLRDKKNGEGKVTYKDESMFIGSWENDF